MTSNEKVWKGIGKMRGMVKSRCKIPGDGHRVLKGTTGAGSAVEVETETEGIGVDGASNTFSRTPGEMHHASCFCFWLRVSLNIPERGKLTLQSSITVSLIINATIPLFSASSTELSYS